jgi:uncharacterized membrane protein YqjE
MSAGLLESARVSEACWTSGARASALQHGAARGAARLATALLGGLAVLVLAALGLAFAAAAFILYVSEAYRLTAAIGVAVFFFAAAAIVALLLRRMAEAKPRAFDATIAELQRDLNTIRQ